MRRWVIDDSTNITDPFFARGGLVALHSQSCVNETYQFREDIGTPNARFRFQV